MIMELNDLRETLVRAEDVIAVQKEFVDLSPDEAKEFGLKAKQGAHGGIHIPDVDGLRITFRNKMHLLLAYSSAGTRDADHARLNEILDSRRRINPLI